MTYYLITIMQKFRLQNMLRSKRKHELQNEIYLFFQIDMKNHP